MTNIIQCNISSYINVISTHLNLKKRHSNHTHEKFISYPVFADGEDEL